MRICLVATNAYEHDPRATTLAHSLRTAGHQVTVVATSPGAGRVPPRNGIEFVPSRRPGLGGPLGTALRRAQPAGLRAVLHERALASVAERHDPTLLYPTAPEAVGAAVRAAGPGRAVVREPRWPSAAPYDLIDLAPGHPELSESPAGAGLPFHTPAHRPEPSTPSPGRHEGRSIVMVYRKTDINPGKYLEAGLRRAGIAVRVETDRLEWATVDPATTAVVFVEGPYPALEVVGENPGIPVVFWAHHGEHHLYANLRLTRRYGAHAVMLAHSWHLAHRFPVPVHRFPFGMATELLDPSMPFEERPLDVAMVGAYVRGGGPYSRRGEIVAAAESVLRQDRLGFASGVDSHEMARLYGSAKVVLNEGGTRHFPITMRVLEAVGAGALLLSDPIPGMDLILEPGRHFVSMERDVAAQLRRLFADEPAMARIAADALEHATAFHTYDHRVDELMAIVDTIVPRPVDPPAPPPSPLGRLVDRDVEVQRIVRFGAAELEAELPDREVWDGDEIGDRLRPAAFDAVAVGRDRVEDLPEGVEAARRYLYVEAPAVAVAGIAADRWPDAEVIDHGSLTKIDLWAPAYRLPREERT